MKKRIILLLVLLITLMSGTYLINNLIKNKKEKLELNECHNKFISMKRNALTIMHGSLLILLDYDTSLTNCYQNKPIWGNIFVPDSVSAMAMDTLKGYIVYAKSLDECVSIRKAQYTADGSLDKIFAMYNEFKNDFEFIKRLNKTSLKELCKQFDVIESDLKTVVNDIKNPVPNPFFSSIWGSHISQLEADIKATNYDVNIGYYSRDKEMDKLFRFMGKYHWILQF